MDEAAEVSTSDSNAFDGFVERIREFIRIEVLPREQVIADADEIPEDLRRNAAEMGLFGYAIPTDYGGLGLDVEHDVRLAFEFGFTALAFRSMFGTNNGIAGQLLVNYGTDAQRSRWLGAMASGDTIAAFALSETGAGSDPTGLRTVASREGSGWVISGHKRFITNAPVAGLFLVFARTRPAEAADPGIAVFLVPRGVAGLHIGPSDRKMGHEGAPTAGVSLDEVRVGEDALVSGDVDTGFRAAMSVLTRSRIHIAGLSVGLADRAVSESVAFAASHRQGDTPIGDFQLVKAMLAEQQTLTMAGRALAIDAARRYASGEDRRVGSSAAKLFCTEMAGKVADLAVQVHGGSGYMRETPVERIYRDARLLRLYEGTSEIQKLIIGRELLRSAGRS